MFSFPSLLCAGSLGDLDGGEENTPDNLSLSGEEGGVSDQDDSVEGDSSSPPPYTPLYNEGKRRKKARYKTHNVPYILKVFRPLCFFHILLFCRLMLK